MKKKLVATLVAGMVLSTGLLSLTACGLSVPKGDKVNNEDAWKTAFERTSDLTDFTFEGSATLAATVKGTVTTTNSSGEKVNKEHNYKLNNSLSALYAYGSDDKAYFEADLKTEKKGTVTGKDYDETSSTNAKMYYELCEEKDNKKTYWQAAYGKIENKSLEEKTSTEKLWQAEKTSYMVDPSVIDISGTSFYADEETTTVSKLSALYEKFTYSDGVYTATLYKDVEVDNIAEDKMACTVKVSIKDGYVIGLSVKIDVKDILYKKSVYDIEYTYKEEETVVLSNIKSTDASKKVNKDIKKAIDKAKAEDE